jgi:hypothetical protein
MATGRARGGARSCAAQTGAASSAANKPTSCHHVVPRQKLRKAGLERLVWDAANGVALTEKEHAAHHSRLRPLPFSCLPACAVEFADEHGFGDWLRRTYPPDTMVQSRTSVLGEG